MLSQTQNAIAENPSRGMFGKLLRYEFRATARLFLPLYLVVLVFGFIGRFSLRSVTWRVTAGSNRAGLWTSVSPEAEGMAGDFLSTLVALLMAAYVLVVLGAVVVHFIICIQRFWKNLMGDEGYLMFTLPVSTDQLLWSKAVPAFVWGLGTTLVVAASVVIIAWSPEGMASFLRALREEIEPEELAQLALWFSTLFRPAFWVTLLLAVLVDGFGGIFALYAAMAIGHTVPRHKIWASIGGYFAISMVEGLAASILSAGLMPAMFRVEAVPETLATDAEVTQFVLVMGDFINGTMLVALAISVVSLAACYLVARYLLNTQLNLE